MNHTRYGACIKVSSEAENNVLRRFPGRFLLAPIIAMFAFTPVAAQTLAEFYTGKTVQIIVGAGPGGGNDAWGRAIARYLGEHLPGSPTVIVRNMPGGGSVVAANHIYNIAAKDGTALGLITRDTAMAPISGVASARFDATKMTWLGSPTVEATICIASSASGVKSIADLKTKELIVGNTGAGTSSYIYPKALNALFGLKFKSISGFPSSSDVYLAIERGEVNGTCGALNTLTTLRPDWIKNKQATVLLQVATERNPELPDVPSVMDFAKDDETRAAVTFLSASENLGRPLIAPPDMPNDRIHALRDGITATLTDASFKTEAKKQKLDVAPISGEKLAATIRQIYQTPKPIVEKMNALVK
jgi:tripartite-type tricarboxylate transporter receptor subunit TctC